MRKTWIAFLLVITLGLTLGCSVLSKADAPSKAGGQGQIPGPSQKAQWPVELPSDIPVLDGKIDQVMEADGANLRIFYDSLTAEQIEQYVEKCRQQGYAVEYLVYTREGFADNSAERLNAGDYDAVQLTKGNYSLRLEYGGDPVTLDVAIANPEPLPSPTALPWPEDIRTFVPQPKQCRVSSIANLSSGGYQIVCEYPDSNIRFDEYLQTLTGLGYRETDRLMSDTNEVVYLTLENESYSVKLMPQSFASAITLQIIRKSP